MDYTEARIRELRTDMYEELRHLREQKEQEIRDLRARIWELEMAPLRLMEKLVILLALAVPALILAGYI